MKTWRAPAGWPSSQKGKPVWRLHVRCEADAGSWCSSMSVHYLHHVSADDAHSCPHHYLHSINKSGSIHESVICTHVSATIAAHDPRKRCTQSYTCLQLAAHLSYLQSQHVQQQWCTCLVSLRCSVVLRPLTAVQQPAMPGQPICHPHLMPTWITSPWHNSVAYEIMAYSLPVP